MNIKPIYLVIRWSCADDGTICEIDQSYTDEKDAHERANALNNPQFKDWDYLKIKLNEK